MTKAALDLFNSIHYLAGATEIVISEFKSWKVKVKEGHWMYSYQFGSETNRLIGNISK